MYSAVSSAYILLVLSGVASDLYPLAAYTNTAGGTEEFLLFYNKTLV